jgi:hypothetical protein
MRYLIKATKEREKAPGGLLLAYPANIFFFGHTKWWTGMHTSFLKCLDQGETREKPGQSCHVPQYCGACTISCMLSASKWPGKSTLLVATLYYSHDTVL